MSQKTNMPEFIRSECPHCHTQYKVSLAQLAAGKNKARCGACDTSFLITDNLADAPSQKQKDGDIENATQSPQSRSQSRPQSLDTLETQPATSTAVAKDSTKKSRKADAFKINKAIPDDELIYDDMLVDSEEPLASSDDDAFAADFGDDWLFTDDLDGAVQARKTNVFDTLAIEDDLPSDDSWIEDLLAEEGLNDTYVDDPFDDSSANLFEKPESFTAPKTNANLSSLLDDLGVQTTQSEAPKSEASIKLPNERLQQRDGPSSAKAPSFSAFNAAIVTPFFWLLGCIALVLLLFAQYIVFNLDALIKEPTQRLRLQEFCSMVNCALPDADISKLIIANQQHLPSTSAANATDIMAAISNQSSHTQLFPNIKVRLYQGDKLKGEFIAKPDEYLVTPQRLMGSSQVTLVMLTVNIAPSTITKVDITPFY